MAIPKTYGISVLETPKSPMLVKVLTTLLLVTFCKAKLNALPAMFGR